ncbi:MAG: amidohydrolase family protein [Halioglobus sp.]|nr:amidohydrolase family protein [Halioglobus sp.]
MMMIANVSIPGRAGRFDVQCAAGLVRAIEPHHPARRERAAVSRAGGAVVDAGGGALLPGLHDHHIHLCALAAARASVRCGPGDVGDAGGLAAALAAVPGAGWIRGVAYHESVAGHLDRAALDTLSPRRPLRLQHRSGKLWMLNSEAAECLDLDRCRHLPGVELDAGGRPTGRLFRLDAWLGQRLRACGQGTAPDLGMVSDLLARRGVTGVTDASPDNGPAAVALFEAAAAGPWRQRLRIMGGDDLPVPGHPRLERGERKIILDEDNLPGCDELADIVRRAHRQGRPVAVHCVTPAELVLALAVLREAGPRPGDRIEHASLVSRDVLPLLRETGVRVVTQPGFIRERGAQYLAAVEPALHGDLYRCASLHAGGIPVAGSTDAPFGDPDPWAAMRAAVWRRCAGVTLGEGERVSPEQALALFTCAADAPGGAARRIGIGAAADLCVLDRSWPEARLRLRRDDVLATIVAGDVVYRRGEDATYRDGSEGNAAVFA